MFCRGEADFRALAQRSHRVFERQLIDCFLLSRSEIASPHSAPLGQRSRTSITPSPCATCILFYSYKPVVLRLKQIVLLAIQIVLRLKQVLVQLIYQVDQSPQQFFPIV